MNGEVTIDTETQNRWILGGVLPGVHFSMCQSVRVIAGPHAGEEGELISIYALTPEPLYHMEKGDGGDLLLRQSALAPLES
jgi:hypothetical protein